MQRQTRFASGEVTKDRKARGYASKSPQTVQSVTTGLLRHGPLTARLRLRACGAWAASSTITGRGVRWGGGYSSGHATAAKGGSWQGQDPLQVHDRSDHPALTGVRLACEPTGDSSRNI